MVLLRLQGRLLLLHNLMMLHGAPDADAVCGPAGMVQQPQQMLLQEQQQQQQRFASAPASPVHNRSGQLAPGVELLRHSWEGPLGDGSTALQHQALQQASGPASPQRSRFAAFPAVHEAAQHEPAFSAEVSQASVSTVAVSLADGLGSLLSQQQADARGRRATEVPRAMQHTPAAAEQQVLQRSTSERAPRGPGAELHSMYGQMVDQATRLGLAQPKPPADSPVAAHRAAQHVGEAQEAADEDELMRRWQGVERQASSSRAASQASSGRPSPRGNAAGKAGYPALQLDRHQAAPSRGSSAASPKGVPPQQQASWPSSSLSSPMSPQAAAPGMVAEQAATAPAAEGGDSEFGKTPVMVKALKTLQEAYAVLSNDKPGSGADSRGSGGRSFNRASSARSAAPPTAAGAAASGPGSRAASRQGSGLSLRSSQGSEGAEVVAVLSTGGPVPGITAPAPVKVQQQQPAAAAVPDAPSELGPDDVISPPGRLTAEVADILATSAVIHKQRSVAMEELGSVLDRVRSIKMELEAGAALGGGVTGGQTAPDVAAVQAAAGQRQQGSPERAASAAVGKDDGTAALLQQLEQLATIASPGSPAAGAASAAQQQQVGAASNQGSSASAHTSPARMAAAAGQQGRPAVEASSATASQTTPGLEQQPGPEHGEQQAPDEDDYAQLMNLSRKLEEIARRWAEGTAACPPVCLVD